ncbi:MAG: rhodanese-like domain-containing protein [Pseudomonadota bacterium]
MQHLSDPARSAPRRRRPGGRRPALAALVALLLTPVAALAKPIASSVDAGALPEGKRTPLGLYLTPEDAHAALEKNPDILFLDVRDPIELSFVGHPEGMDANVPLALASSAFDPRAGRYRMTANPDFRAQAEAAAAARGLDKSAPVFLICRSGVRSAAAARILAEAGFSNVWNLIEGFEGDRDKLTGRRTANGWRNAGLPWAYKIPADAAWTPAR